MSRNVIPTGAAVSGQRVRLFASAVLRAYGSICHLCGRSGADTVDHLLPVHTHPELRWEIDNVRPAHRSCNSARGDAPLVSAYEAESW